MYPMLLFCEILFLYERTIQKTCHWQLFHLYGCNPKYQFYAIYCNKTEILVGNKKLFTNIYYTILSKIAVSKHHVFLQVSNLRINEQNAAALAGARVR